MTTLAPITRRPRVRAAECDRTPGGGRRPDGDAADATPRLFDTPAGEPTLAALIGGVWAQLAANRRAECPICGGELLASAGAHAQPAAGRCRDCGTTLS